MPSRILNLGILAHVDAGKTSLTERLLFDHGVTAELGSVDRGDTQTDSGEMERRRGITIRSAVVAFSVGGLQINLVDTPGHPDFIAEVERALSVLDGVVLVISAVEGVQAQTRVLMRSLKRLGLPTVIFVNKIDRTGARYGELLAEIRRRLTPAVLPMVCVNGLGTPGARVETRSFAMEAAELLAEQDERLLGLVVDGVVPGRAELRELLERQTLAGLVHPVYFGSATSGAGVTELVGGVRDLLVPERQHEPHHERRPEDVGPRGTVFAVERDDKGEKVAYLRLFAGEVRERQRVTFRRRGAQEHTGRISSLDVIRAGDSPRSREPNTLAAGHIARVRGLPEVKVGDTLGTAENAVPLGQFPPPVLESLVRPEHPARASELHAALLKLADEDPLIRVRTEAGAISVSLYGEVQKEVIAERLSREFGVTALFERTRPVCFERPAGTGSAVHEFDPRGPNEFWQTVGLRVAPGTGNTFTCEAEWGLLPRAYHRAIEDAAMAALEQGPHGRPVADCAVTLTKVGCEAPMTTPGDFRELTPLILRQALSRAGTVLFEPGYRIEVEVPEDTLSPVIGHLMSLAAQLGRPVRTGTVWTVTGQLPARNLQRLATALPGLTRGEGMLWYEPGDDRRITGTGSTRPTGTPS